MEEEPIKLFATRAELLPQQTGADTLRDAIETGIEQVPGGSILTFFTQHLWQPVCARRLEEWLKDFANDYDQHCKECRPLREQVKDEVFVTASMQIARMVTATHNPDKLRYLRNALLNIASGQTASEVLRDLLLSALESLSPAQIKILSTIQKVRNSSPIYKDPSMSELFEQIQQDIVELRGSNKLSSTILADLDARGLTICNPMHAGMEFPKITAFGNALLKFVLPPSDLKRAHKS